MTIEPVHMKVMSHPENLQQIRSRIADITSKAGFSKDTAGSIILAVDEACSNVIKHSYKRDHTKEIEVELMFEDNSLTISIIDAGIKFDVTAVEKRDVTEVRPGGLGLYIIEQVMDNVEYCTTKEGRNKLKMTKKLDE